jgi:16S rRNA (cytidine1402-2'-O)-methyltransferase
LISDPGFPLVRAAVEAGHAVVPIPGPCAALAGLVASALPIDRFSFEGALPRSRSARRLLFEGLAHRESTTAFYESPHRILDSLRLLAEILPDRLVVLARELTKVHEEFLRGSADELIETLEGRDRVRGEFVLILNGAVSSEKDDLDAARSLLAVLEAEGLPKRSLLRILVQGLGVPRNEAYRLVHRNEDD